MLVTVYNLTFFYGCALPFYKPLDTGSFWQLLIYVCIADVLRGYVKIILTKEIDI